MTVPNIPMTVFAGGYKTFLKNGMDAKPFSARAAERHPGYDDNRMTNDAALIYLTQCVPMGPATGVAQIATQDGGRRARVHAARGACGLT